MGDTGTETSYRVVERRPDDLDVPTAHALWRLRQDVFVVEQECPYPDLDGRDLLPTTRHLVLEEVAGDGAPEVVGCLRLLDAADAADEQEGPVRLGRVVLARRVRGRGLADLLVRAALDRVGDREVVLDAQEPLAGWYAGFGWEVSGPGFLEDGIPHVPMRRPADGGPAVVPPDPADPAEL